MLNVLYFVMVALSFVNTCALCQEKQKDLHSNNSVLGVSTTYNPQKNLVFPGLYCYYTNYILSKETGIRLDVGVNLPTDYISSHIITGIATNVVTNTSYIIVAHGGIGIAMNTKRSDAGNEQFGEIFDTKSLYSIAFQLNVSMLYSSFDFSVLTTYSRIPEQNLTMGVRVGLRL